MFFKQVFHLKYLNTWVEKNIKYYCNLKIMCHKLFFSFLKKNIVKSRMLFSAVNIIVEGFDLRG